MSPSGPGRSAPGLRAHALARLDVGVAIFFVLAGFLLLRPGWHALPRRQPAPGTVAYLWRRALRILPAYWVVVVVACWPCPDNSRQPVPPTWLRHVTLTQVYGLGWQRHGLTQTWSLCTEVAFYLVLPVLAVMVLGRTGWHPGAALAVLPPHWSCCDPWHLLCRSWGLDSRVAGQWLPGYLGLVRSGYGAGGRCERSRSGTGPRGRFDGGSRRGCRRPWACWMAALAFLPSLTTPLAGPRDLSSPTGGGRGQEPPLFGRRGGSSCCPRCRARGGRRTRGVLKPPRGMARPDLLRRVPLAPLRARRGRPTAGSGAFHRQLALIFVLTWGGSVALPRPATRPRATHPCGCGDAFTQWAHQSVDGTHDAGQGARAHRA